MADTSLIIGNGNWAVKETSLLGYNIIQSKYVPIEMTVVRVTTATRVNSDGLIEVVPINLLTYSEQFDNAVWTKIGTITVTANQTTAPNGNNTADLILGADIASYIQQTYNSSIGVVYTSSFFIKNNNSTQSALLIRNLITVVSSTLNWSGSVLNSITSAVGTSTFQDYGNGWYRIVSTYTSIEATQRPRIIPTTSTNQSVYLWGAQLVTGTSAKEYFPTTDRFNIPRVDYSTGTASLLVEPQRTNLALYSEEFDNIYWTKVTTNITANTAIAPDGTMTADTFTPTSAVTTSAIQRTFTGITGSHTISVYARVDTGTKSFRFFRFNATDGNVSSPTFTATTTWQRFTWNTSPTITSSWFIANASTDLVPFFVWGAQLEAGSNATSYIPTTAAIATRNADVISKTGISSLIGQTEGTLYAEINNTLMTSYSAGYVMRIFADANNEVWIRKEAGSNTYTARWRANSTNVYTQLNIAVLNGNNKIAIAYKSTDSAVYLNGSQIGTSAGTGAFSVAPSQIGIGSSSTIDFFNDRIELATLFPTRLTNAQLATLTTI